MKTLFENSIVFARSASDLLIATPGFFAQDDNAPHPWSPSALAPGALNSASAGLAQWRSSLELLIAVLSFLCSIGFFFYFSRHHYQERSTYGRTRWSTEQINACLIPLAIAVTFAVLYFVFG